MQVTSSSTFFKKSASMKLDDPVLQESLRKFKGKFVVARANAVAEVDAWEAVRAHAARLRDRAIENLDAYLVEFERNATRRGAQVHWAETAEAACEIVVGIAKANAVRKVTKSKSMVSEEVNLNEALEAAGVKVVETDLGEYILQLAGEPPSHIVAPAVHKSKEEVADLFVAAHHKPRLTDIPAMTREAREALREHFLTADMGISGANFVIAETGTTLTVTNEGNADLVTTIPRIHCVITGIEKVIPTLEDFATLIRLLPRSATGQTIANYLTLTTGVKAPGETDGPEQMHIVLVDAGRTKLVGTDMQEMLRCIRCGACMNHCPVYQNVGGHAYGWVYPGPMGSILTPTYVGLENAGDLPNAATFCGECSVVCPVKIPLPDLMRKLREKQFDRKLRPWAERAGVAMWGFAARRPGLYALLTKVAARVAAWMGGRDRLIHSLPGLDGWTKGRDMPAPEGRTFRELYARRSLETPIPADTGRRSPPMTARENILGRIRKAQGRAGAEPTPEEMLAIRAVMTDHEIGPMPGIALPVDQLGQFKSECARLGSTHAQLQRLEDVPGEVGRYLAEMGLEKRAVAWHELASLDWNAAGVAIDDRPANGDDRTGITGCFCAIAETGTVLLLSSPAQPKATALLPETHICIVSRSRLVDTMEEAFAMVRNEVGEPPRAMFFVSGPSRTADIEQTIVVGAHGPYRVHVLLVP